MPTRTCPYCNALLDGDTPCAVCGEQPVGAPPTAAPPRPASNRRAALVVVVAMLACAGVALGYALWTQADRRANDQGPGPRPPRSPFDPIEPAASVLVPPDRLTALRYLPAGIDLLVGVHFAALYDDPATRPLLEQPLPVGPTTVRLADLRAWTGLDPDAIDHAVLGVGLPRGGLLPRVVLVVRGRRPVDGEAVKAALRATEDATAGLRETKRLWNVRLTGVNLPASLWLTDDRTLVFGLTAADLAGLPVVEAERLGQISERLKELMRTRLDAGVAAWSVGSFPDGLGKAVGPTFPVVVQGLTLSPGQRQAIAGLHGIAAGVVPGETVRCGLSLHLENADGAAQVVRYLRGPEGGKEGSPRVESDGASVLLQWKTTPDELARLLRR